MYSVYMFCLQAVIYLFKADVLSSHDSIDSYDYFLIFYLCNKTENFQSKYMICLYQTNYVD